MTHHQPSPEADDSLDELVTQLLECGGLLSQIISNMVRFEASGRSVPDSAPIPEVAHSVVRDVLGDLQERHPKRDLEIAATIVRESAEAIYDNIFFVGPEMS